MENVAEQCWGGGGESGRSAAAVAFAEESGAVVEGMADVMLDDGVTVGVGVGGVKMNM